MGKEVIVVVAHPDDETLWAGGLLLDNISWNVYIICLCRGSDSNRAPRFQKAIKLLNAKGIMGDLDDGPEQIPLNKKELEDVILDLLPTKSIDLLISHSPFGEYTRHRRHEEIGEALLALWAKNKIRTKNLWLFAYKDGNRAYPPKAISKAKGQYPLSDETFKKKYSLITETYGFAPISWEAKSCPKIEAFWQFSKLSEAVQWKRLRMERTRLHKY